MASDLTIIIKAVDKASAEMKKVKTSTQGLKDMAAGLGIALGAAAVAAGVLKKAYDVLITPTMQYGLQVKDLSNRIGVTSQEASKLIQVFDDLRIDMTAGQTAFRFLVTQGIQPTIDNLATLSDQYRAIEDPIKQAEFAMKNFGARGGLEMTKLLVVGGPALKAMAAEAEALGLVLGEDAVQAAQDFYDATDKMNDSVKGLQISMGAMFLPTAAEFTDWLTRLATGFKNAVTEGDSLFEVLMLLGVFMRDTAEARDAAQQGFIEFSDVLRGRVAPAADGAATAIDALSQAETLNAAATAIMAGDTGLAKSLMAGWTAADTLEKKLAAITDQLSAGVSVDTLGMRAMMGGLGASAPVPLPPLDTSGWQGALTRIDYTQFPNLQKALDDGVVAPVKESLRLLDGMDGRVITTKQNIYQTTYKKTVYVSGQGVGHATGADFVVPPGYPNDSYPMRVESGEHVQVTPARSRNILDANQTAKAGGVTINVTSSPLDTAYMVRAIKAAVGM